MIYLLPRDFLTHRAQSIRLYPLAFDNFDFMPLELLAPSHPLSARQSTGSQTDRILPAAT
ncbi:hypothetical protein BDQ94DRAFT_152598 [Aspergillus welwitschiae]|uniref:Uncharacterized protein n=1 Tax=Aspergillus welwitschiae TaxID=1341132 RepID=A0A3F3PMF5_9EURO|nr:hypothetical protein BDQ94DRAFT_152598 [Aspergillus welwitschiae]RDH28125.1 hypothetical protein BDQ94DRAFT_152598 [Aspergillus welwitschiae]